MKVARDLNTFRSNSSLFRAVIVQELTFPLSGCVKGFLNSTGPPENQKATLQTLIIYMHKARFWLWSSSCSLMVLCKVFSSCLHLVF